MEKHTAQNIQDAFLNSARRDKNNVTFQLMNGETLLGKIKSFDKFSVLVDVSGKDFLLFKHAISNVSVEKKETNSNVQVKYLGRKIHNT